MHALIWSAKSCLLILLSFPVSVSSISYYTYSITINQRHWVSDTEKQTKLKTYLFQCFLQYNTWHNVLHNLKEKKMSNNTDEHQTLTLHIHNDIISSTTSNALSTCIQNRKNMILIIIFQTLYRPWKWVVTETSGNGYCTAE